MRAFHVVDSNSVHLQDCFQRYYYIFTLQQIPQRPHMDVVSVQDTEFQSHRPEYSHCTPLFSHEVQNLVVLHIL